MRGSWVHVLLFLLVAWFVYTHFIRKISIRPNK